MWDPRIETPVMVRDRMRSSRPPTTQRRMQPAWRPKAIRPDPAVSTVAEVDGLPELLTVSKPSDSAGEAPTVRKRGEQTPFADYMTRHPYPPTFA